MAEVLATMVVGPLVSMVKEKASSYLLDQYKVMEGMEEQHKLLKRKLPAVLDVITDAEEQAAKNREGAKAWLEELRNVAYKANDVLDEFKYEALRRKAKAEGHYKEFGMDVIKLFPSHNRFVFRYRMANKLRMILQEIDVLIAEMNTFRFEFKPQPPMYLKLRQTDPNTPDNFVKIAGESRATEKKEIIDALLGQADNVGLTVLPVVGMGGMGKTTLAQLVYNDPAIQEHFQMRLWVCVSENFDVDSLAERIVEAAKANGCQAEGTTALDKLKNAVSRKRYLLILDDIWNREVYKWKKLSSSLHHGGTGSSVVTTTRDEYIAHFMGTIKTHEIKGLDVNIIEDIIKTGAFGSQAKVPTEFEQLVTDIANRCKGSPLAATALGFALCTKHTVKEWNDVLSRNTICDEENIILPILKLSYNCLPPHMRQCFAFCAMFPKDHEIDVEMLIQLWMANCFIPERKGVCPEVTCKQIFNELTQRSFFQEVKQDQFYRQTTCKIHDLMHDVAQDSMGKECATIDRKLSQSEDFPYNARHLFLSVGIQEKVLNDSTEKESLGFQTLICDESITQDLSHLLKYRSVRALKTRQVLLLEPKYLHHLRYLDLAGSDIKALPEDITILYHLQTLSLFYCDKLEQLPKAMKYMTALRHLYTHGCSKLKCMPPELGHLTSLQTLTCFVACTGSDCSNVGELEKLDLGGQLELSQLENVVGADAKAANLGSKKRLEELTLRWTVDHDNKVDKKVLESLRPPDGLKAMMMYSYGGNAIPTWMLELQSMVELELCDCQNLENLPALWHLPALQFISLRNLQDLHCLFSGGAPSKFQKLKTMVLYKMPKFETWWDTNDVQGEEPLFPEVEYLRIENSGSLAVFPKASVVKQSSGKDDTECRSAFPALRGMELRGLEKFHGWEALEGTLGEQVTFPQLENVDIWNCSGLTTFPVAPNLRTLNLGECREEASLQAASRYIYSVSSLSLSALPNSNNNRGENSIESSFVLGDYESQYRKADLVLSSCNLFFSHSSAPENCFGQLSQLRIDGFDDLVYWPENLFQGLVSLRTLEICRCSKLTGYTNKEEASGVQSLVRLPRLESLEIDECASLVQVPNLSSASLRTLCIKFCASLKSVVFGGEQDEEDTRMLVRGEGFGFVQPAETSSSLIAAGSSSTSSEAMVSTAVVRKLSSSSSAGSCSNQCFFPCLEYLGISDCRSLTEVANFPPSIKTLEIYEGCSSLVSLSGGVLSLEKLNIDGCACLESLPNGPHQVYSSLKFLEIRSCGDIKQLPWSQQQSLQNLDEKDLDPHHEEQVELDSKPESMSDGATTTVVLKQSSSTSSNHSVFPCLESLVLSGWHGLTEVANLPPSIKTLQISECRSLVSLLGEVQSLKKVKVWLCPRLESLQVYSSSLELLSIIGCECLESLPDGPQAYSSLRVLCITECSGIKQLPPSLQQRLDHLEEKELDPHLLQGRPVPVPARQNTSLSLRSKLACFRSRSED